jgi:hypothetical protein
MGNKASSTGAGAGAVAAARDWRDPDSKRMDELYAQLPVLNRKDFFDELMSQECFLFNATSESTGGEKIFMAIYSKPNDPQYQNIPLSKLFKSLATHNDVYFSKVYTPMVKMAIPILESLIPAGAAASGGAGSDSQVGGKHRASRRHRRASRKHKRANRRTRRSA